MTDELKKTEQPAAAAEAAASEPTVEPPVTADVPPPPPPRKPPADPGAVANRSWLMSVHLASFAMFTGIPFANLFAPMIIWLIKRDSLPAMDAHGKESLNFQISLTIYYIIAGILCLVFVGFLFLPILFVLHIIFVIQATVAADKGEMYHYPLSMRFIS